MHTFQIVMFALWTAVSVGIGAAAYVGSKDKPWAHAIAVALLWPVLAVVALVIAVIVALVVAVVTPFKWWRERREARATERIMHEWREQVRAKARKS